MKSTRRHLVPAFAFFLASVALQPAAAEGFVNDVPVTRAMWDDAVRLASATHADLAAARQSAAAACVRDIVVMQLARAAGLTPVRTESDLRRLHDEENVRRAARLAGGEPVFGPKQLGWTVFRRTWFDAICRDLRRLEEYRAPPTVEELRAFHGAHPERFVARDGGLLPFDEYRDFVCSQLMELRLEARIAAAVAKADVRWEWERDREPDRR